jgi:hypothetical protein
MGRPARRRPARRVGQGKDRQPSSPRPRCGGHGLFDAVTQARRTGTLGNRQNLHHLQHGCIRPCTVPVVALLNMSLAPQWWLARDDDSSSFLDTGRIAPNADGDGESGRGPLAVGASLKRGFSRFNSQSAASDERGVCVQHARVGERKRPSAIPTVRHSSSAKKSSSTANDS